MPWKNHFWYFVVAATLTSSKGLGGQGVETEAVAQRSTLPGRLHFRTVASGGVSDGSGVPARYGSLSFQSGTGGEGEQKSNPVLHSSMDAKLKHLDPLVQCGNNLMTLKVKRARAPHILVDSGEGPLTPLAQMPSSCGYSVRKSRRDVLFSAQYQGCHVSQRHGDYVLPLRLWGAPVTMSCPTVLPPPSVSCFPSGMVVKFGGVSANQLKVKVSGTWVPLSSVCSSCGLDVEALSGGLALSAPYYTSLCIEIKGEEYSLSLLLGDVEVTATCPVMQVIPTTTSTTVPPRDIGQVLPQHIVFPLPWHPNPIHPHTKSAAASVDQQPHFPSGLAVESDYDNKNQAEPAVQHPSFAVVEQYPQLWPYVFYPRPVLPTQATTTSTSTTTTKSTPAAQAPQLTEFPVPPQYHFFQYPKFPLPPEGQLQAAQDLQPVAQQPKPPYVHPQKYQIPIMYPPLKNPYQNQHPQNPTAAPTTTTTSAATTLKPVDQKLFYHPHPYMPLYYFPQQAPMPVFPDPPATPLEHSAPFDQGN